VQYRAASGKCFNARNYQQKTWNTPFCPLPVKKKMRKAAMFFVQESGIFDQYLQGMGLR